MGYFSEQMIHEAEQRLRLGGLKGKKVCSNCFGDPHLSKLIEKNADADACDYCGDKGEGVQATDLTTVLEYMLPQIDLEFDRADEALPQDPETKDRMFPEDEMDTRTMLEMEIGLDLPRDYQGTLMEAIAGAMPEQDWCYQDPLIELPADRVGNSWDAFKKVVTHRRRFFLLQYEDTDLDYDLTWGSAAYTIPELLKSIAQFTLEHGLVIPMKAKTPWVRCQRMKPEDHDFDAARMGPPPYERATLPNRMSPVGVPMFYGAIDRETALAEIADIRPRARGHGAGRRASPPAESMPAIASHLAPRSVREGRASRRSPVAGLSSKLRRRETLITRLRLPPVMSDKAVYRT